MENWSATSRRMKLDHFLTPYTKINSKWMKDLSVRQESTKIIEENTGSNLFDISHSNFLLGKGNKRKHELLGLHQDKKPLHSKRKQSTKLKGKVQNGRIYLQMTYLIKGSYPKSMKNLSISIPKKTQKSQSRSGQKIRTDISPKNISKWPTDI